MSLQILFDALSLGGIYAIAALGIALIFGVMKLVNFAHGQFIACSVFALILPSADAVAVLGLGALPAGLLIPAILLFGAGLAVLAETFVFRPLRNASLVFDAKGQVQGELYSEPWPWRAQDGVQQVHCVLGVGGLVDRELHLFVQRLDGSHPLGILRLVDGVHSSEALS